MCVCVRVCVCVCVCPLGAEKPVLALLSRRFGGSAEHLHVVVGPGHHVARHVVGAVGHAEHVLRPQDAIPDVKVAQLTHEGLGGIEAASHDVLLRP